MILPRYKGSEKLLELLKTAGFENIYEVEQFQKEFKKNCKER